MKVTNVSIKKIDSRKESFKGLATVVLDDCLAIHDIKIIEKEDKVFLSFPSNMLNICMHTHMKTV